MKAMKDRLLTIVLSIAATLAVDRLIEDRRSPPREAAAAEPVRELTVDRLIVRRELIVSDTGQPWEEGFADHQIPRGMVARSLAHLTGSAHSRS